MAPIVIDHMCSFIFMLSYFMHAYDCDFVRCLSCELYTRFSVILLECELVVRVDIFQ